MSEITILNSLIYLFPIKTVKLYEIDQMILIIYSLL